MKRRSYLHRIAPFLASFALFCALAGAGAGATLARDEAPAITPFATAHLVIAGMVSAQGQELPVQGEGDIDAARGASRLTVALLGAAFETIVVDGRTYNRSGTTGRWEYSEGAGANGFNAARLAPYDPATIRAAGRNFVRIGPETIDGAATTHWRADADLARLIGVVPGAGPGGFDSSAATMDLWIGDADWRLRRLVVVSQGATPTASAAASPPRLNLTLTFSNFDQPVPIIAPLGAVPAATPRAIPIGTPIARASATSAANIPATPVAPLPNDRLVEATSGRGIISATVVLRVVSASSIVMVLVAVLVAVRHRQQRQVGAADE